jgi:chromosome segregation ATPase
MSDTLVDNQTDAMEHAEHSRHAAESGDPLTLNVTLSIAIMAVIAAFIGALGETEEAHTFVEKNDAVLAQAKASDAWAEYQAESLKRHIYDLGATLAAQPEAADKLKTQIDTYNKKQAVAQDDAKHHEAEVAAFGAEAETHFERHHIITIAEGIVHVAIAGSSIALLSRRRFYWLASLGLTGLGIVVTGLAYLL